MCNSFRCESKPNALDCCAYRCESHVNKNFWFTNADRQSMWATERWGGKRERERGRKRKRSSERPSSSYGVIRTCKYIYKKYTDTSVKSIVREPLKINYTPIACETVKDLTMPSVCAYACHAIARATCYGVVCQPARTCQWPKSLRSPHVYTSRKQQKHTEEAFFPVVSIILLLSLFLRIFYSVVSLLFIFLLSLVWSVTSDVDVNSRHSKI